MLPKKNHPSLIICGKQAIDVDGEARPASRLLARWLGRGKGSVRHNEGRILTRTDLRFHKSREIEWAPAQERGSSLANCPRGQPPSNLRLNTNRA